MICSQSLFGMCNVESITVGLRIYAHDLVGIVLLWFYHISLWIHMVCLSAMIKVCPLVLDQSYDWRPLQHNNGQDSFHRLLMQICNSGVRWWMIIGWESLIDGRSSHVSHLVLSLYDSIWLANWKNKINYNQPDNEFDIHMMIWNITDDLGIFALSQSSC